MTGIKEFINFSFIRVCNIHLEEIRKRYPNKEWIKMLVGYSRSELRDVLGDLMLPGIAKIEKENLAKSAGGEKILTDKILYSLVCDLKEQFEPEDYLFFKAVFTDDEKDRIFLLQQAQMIAPENLRLHIMISFFLIDDEVDSLATIQHMDSLLLYSKEADLRFYAQLQKTIKSLTVKELKISPLEIAIFLNTMETLTSFRYSLLSYFMEHADALTMKKILDHLTIHGHRKHWIYQLARGRVCNELGEYEDALKWFEYVLKNQHQPNYFRVLEINYRMSIAYKNSGKEGRAILLLREIVSEDFEASASDYYYHAITDLAAYYVRIEQAHEADYVLSRLSVCFIDYAEECVGEKFLVMMADLSLLKCNPEQALIYYKKAFMINSKPEFKEKIQALESGKL